MPAIDRLLGNSVAIRALHAELRYVVPSEAKVLITGESGTGKEVVAQIIHEQSRRSRESLVVVNCAGVPDTLLESELFGHARGSFTGAHADKRGLLELADRGTVFLDEIGEMSLRMQALLLRFLENGEIQRVGSERHQRAVDVRVISATNRDLSSRVAANGFREDLYYRLNVIRFDVPPLRERAEDVPLLLDHFLRMHGAGLRVVPPQIAEDALAVLQAYRWPGNVRELRNVAERLVIRSQGRLVQPADLPAEIVGHARGPAATVAPPAGTGRDAALFDRMARDGESFWTAVYQPYMARTLTREELRRIVERGLEATRGSYRGMAHLFNLPETDYRRMLAFLRKQRCVLPFQQFRCAPNRTQPDAPAPRTPPPSDTTLSS